jgi:L-threonylcarbamoyladenylate synthase
MRILQATQDVDRLAGCIADVLLRGGVALIPTDTVYGLAAHPSRTEAVERIYEIKHRPRERRLPVIVEGSEQVESLGLCWTEPARRLATAFWPGALTIAVGVQGSPVVWLEGRVEVAVRAPASELARSLARLIGPYLMTSANSHGLATRTTLREVLDDLDGCPNVAVDGGELSGVSSTLVNTNLPRSEIEREGAIPAPAIDEILAGA